MPEVVTLGRLLQRIQAAKLRQGHDKGSRDYGRGFDSGPKALIADPLYLRAQVKNLVGISQQPPKNLLFSRKLLDALFGYLINAVLHLFVSHDPFTHPLFMPFWNIYQFALSSQSRDKIIRDMTLAFFRAPAVSFAAISIHLYHARADKRLLTHDPG